MPAGLPAPRPLFVPGEISRKKLRFEKPVVMYVSPNNPGALATAQMMQQALPQLKITALPPEPVRDALGTPSNVSWEDGEPTVTLLYLNGETYMGEAGERLAVELVAAQKAGCRLLMLHENDGNKHGCEFGVFFDGRTPDELLQGGIYKALAIALFPGAGYQPVSIALAATALGAIDGSSHLGKLWGGLLHRIRTPWSKARGHKTSAVVAAQKVNMLQRSQTQASVTKAPQNV